MPKNKAAVALGKLGAAARQRNTTPAKRKAIASDAAIARWAKVKCKECGGHGGGHFEDCTKRK